MSMLLLALAISAAGWLYPLGLYGPVRWDSTAVCLSSFIPALLLGLYRVAPSGLSQGGKLKWLSAWFIPLTSSILCFQALVVAGYTFLAPNENMLPFGAKPAALLLRWLGYDCVAQGSYIYLQDFAKVHTFSVTIEKWAVLPLALYLIGAWILFRFLGHPLKRSTLFLLILLPSYGLLRFIGMLVMYADRTRMDIFWNPWWTFVSLIPLLVVTKVLADLWLTNQPKPEASGSSWYALILAPLGFCLVAGLAFWLTFQAPGAKKPGRILIDEYHSDWEWTEIPFDREHYGEQVAYNYRVLYQWLKFYYAVDLDMDQPITPELLKNYDVLIEKTPTLRYQPDEIETIVQFVKDGGGLYLIGDHNNLFGMNGYLNQLGEHFGIRFRYDDTFDLTTGSPSFYSSPRLYSHPGSRTVRDLEFQTTCTVKIPWLAERVIVGYGLGREFVDYGHVNFFGDIQPDPDEGYGPFLIAGATRYGKGRIMTYTDSTMLSNFSLFFDGVSEVAFGGIEYLNQENGSKLLNYLALTLALLTILPIIIVLRVSRSRIALATLPIGCVLGYLVTGLLVTHLHATLYPPVEPHTAYERVGFSKQYSNFRVATLLEYNSPDAFRVFDVFFINTQRLDLYPYMANTFQESLQRGSYAVLINPEGQLTTDDQEALKEFLNKGGKFLVLAPYMQYNEALSDLLTQFGMAVGLDVSDHESLPPPLMITGATRVEPPPELCPPKNFALAELAYGRGKILVMLGSHWLSREHVEKSFHLPTEQELNFYRLGYFLFDTLNGAGQAKGAEDE